MRYQATITIEAKEQQTIFDAFGGLADAVSDMQHEGATFTLEELDPSKIEHVEHVKS